MLSAKSFRITSVIIVRLCRLSKVFYFSDIIFKGANGRTADIFECCQASNFVVWHQFVVYDFKNYDSQALSLLKHFN